MGSDDCLTRFSDAVCPLIMLLEDGTKRIRQESSDDNSVFGLIGTILH